MPLAAAQVGRVEAEESAFADQRGNNLRSQEQIDVADKEDGIPGRWYSRL